VTVQPPRRAPEITLLMDLAQGLVALALRSLDAAQGKVNLAQFRALRVLNEMGPCKSGALATALQLHPSTVTRLGDRLLAAGFVTRTVKPDNRREVELDITRAGRQVVDAVLTFRTRELEAVVAHMSPAAAEQLRDVLPALVVAQHRQDALHDLPGATPPLT